MNDIVERLREPISWPPNGLLLDEAADEIERLRMEIMNLKKNMDALVKDAARYRWLCDCAGREFEALLPYQMMGQMGDAIDRATQEVKE